MECASVFNNADWLDVVQAGTLLAPRSCIAAAKMCADVVRIRKSSHTFMSLLTSVMKFLLFMHEVPDLKHVPPSNPDHV